MYNIYFDKRVVKLINSKDFDAFKNDMPSDTVVLLPESEEDLMGLPEKMRQNPNIDRLVAVYENEDKALELFGSRLVHINAGGGIVKNDKGQLLTIFRRGTWDLPKGKQEKGEAIEDTALREVEEETGIKGLKINGLIGITMHTYDTYGDFCLKFTHWYDMSCSGNLSTVPQQEEDIEIAKWMSLDEFREAMQHTYPSLKEIAGRI